MALQNASSREYKNEEALLPDDVCMCRQPFFRPG
jgi:hypothetical protein